MTPEQKSQLLNLQEQINLADNARINGLKIVESAQIIKDALESILADIRREIAKN